MASKKKKSSKQPDLFEAKKSKKAPKKPTSKKAAERVAKKAISQTVAKNQNFDELIANAMKMKFKNPYKSFPLPPEVRQFMNLPEAQRRKAWDLLPATAPKKRLSKSRIVNTVTHRANLMVNTLRSFSTTAKKKQVAVEVAKGVYETREGITIPQVLNARSAHAGLGEVGEQLGKLASFPGGDTHEVKFMKEFMSNPTLPRVIEKVSKDGGKYYGDFVKKVLPKVNEGGGFSATQQGLQALGPKKKAAAKEIVLATKREFQQELAFGKAPQVSPGKSAFGKKTASGSVRKPNEYGRKARIARKVTEDKRMVMESMEAMIRAGAEDSTSPTPAGSGPRQTSKPKSKGLGGSGRKATGAKKVVAASGPKVAPIAPNFFFGVTEESQLERGTQGTLEHYSSRARASGGFTPTDLDNIAIIMDVKEQHPEKRRDIARILMEQVEASSKRSIHTVKPFSVLKAVTKKLAALAQSPTGRKIGGALATVGKHTPKLLPAVIGGVMAAPAAAAAGDVMLWGDVAMKHAAYRKLKKGQGLTKQEQKTLEFE